MTTERIRALVKKLEEREQDRELLERLVDNIPVMIVKWKSDLNHFELNRHATEVLGWTTEDANRGDFMSMVYPDPGYRAQVVEYMESLNPGWKEWTVTAKSGASVPCTWANIRLADKTMVGIGIDLRERKRHEEELARINEQLEDLVAERTAESEARATQLQRLASELSRTEQRERKRLAHVLHDDLQQLLAAARFPIDRLKNAAESGEVKEMADNVDKLIRQAMHTSQSLSHELAPQSFSDCSLADGLRWCADWCKEKFGISIETVIDADTTPFSEDTRLFLLNSVRELLFNIHKHADTSQATIRMEEADHVLRLTVADEGKGGKFDASHVSPAAGGFGLFSISERLDAMGGSMQIVTHPGHGTAIMLELPFLEAGNTNAEPGASLYETANAKQEDMKHYRGVVPG